MVFADYKALLDQLEKNLELTKESCQKIIENSNKESVKFYADIIFTLRADCKTLTSQLGSYPQHITDATELAEIRRLIYIHIDNMQDQKLMDLMNEVQKIVEELYK